MGIRNQWHLEKVFLWNIIILKNGMGQYSSWIMEGKGEESVPAVGWGKGGTLNSGLEIQVSDLVWVSPDSVEKVMEI